MKELAGRFVVWLVALALVTSKQGGNVFGDPGHSAPLLRVSDSPGMLSYGRVAVLVVELAEGENES